MTEKIRINYNPLTPFNLAKWVIYVLLMVNVYFFFMRNWAATSVLYPEGLGLANAVVGFADSIDTAAWVLLILIFELETYILPDELIKGITKFFLHALRILLYVIIIYSFYGYITGFFDLSAFKSTDFVPLCSLANGTNSFMVSQDLYELLTTKNCSTISQSQTLYMHATQSIYADIDTLNKAKGLGAIDVINSGTWLLICLVLEISVRLELKDMLEGKKAVLIKYLKFSLYAILLSCAIYWGINGKFVDFWDAFLWILAFAAIEMNIFQWHQEQSPQINVSASPN